ncbi:MAG: hypothetical protein ABR498_08460 [Candidatus Dormibacteria bacterium]
MRIAIRICVAIVTACVSNSMTADAATPWWSPVGLQDTALTGVAASGKTIDVRTDNGRTLRSVDAGAHFDAVPGDPPVKPPRAVSAGPYGWAIDATGHVLRRDAASSAFVVDAGTPDLGSGANLIAAPGALPGVVVAVATDGTVWRRGSGGDWRRALLLLPQSLVQGVPRITSVAAFSRPLSDTVYLGSDGYAVLDSTNGGDDWLRAGPGLPDGVNALATDDGAHAVYAATSHGLWVHVLQTLPAPPAYSDAQLVWRWIGIALITVIASAAAAVAMLRALREAPAPSARA